MPVLRPMHLHHGNRDRLLLRHPSTEPSRLIPKWSHRSSVVCTALVYTVQQRRCGQLRDRSTKGRAVIDKSSRPSAVQRLPPLAVSKPMYPNCHQAVVAPIGWQWSKRPQSEVLLSYDVCAATRALRATAVLTNELTDPTHRSRRQFFSASGRSTLELDLRRRLR